MLPLDQSWYRKLLALAVLFGVGGGIAALVVMGAINYLIGLMFANTPFGWLGGQWWWIPLTAAGALLVTFLRQMWKVPDEVPGSIALAKQAWIEPRNVIPWTIISAVSLLTGASLGPSFTLIILGGGLGSWLVTRLRLQNEELARQDYTLTGMAGSLGAAFSAPLFATVLASELSPTEKKHYVAAFFTQLIAATIGYLIYYGATGSTLLGSYELPQYDFQMIDLVYAVGLGVFSAVVLILFGIIRKLVTAAARPLRNRYMQAAVGGALVGLVAYALPLTATAGSSQLAVETQNYATMSVGFITALLLGKMLAIALSQESGFLGGIVFPIIFIGGTAGVLVHTILPTIPIALSVSAMLAAVPGAFLNAPLSLILIAAGTVEVGPEALAPIGLAVISAHITLALIQAYIVRRQQIELRAGHTE